MVPFCFRPMEIESKLQTQIKQTEEVNNQNLVVFPVGSNVQVIAVKLGRNKTLCNKTSLFIRNNNKKAANVQICSNMLS